MGNAVRKQADLPFVARADARVARGGPVADLQQLLQERIAGRDLAKVALAPAPEPLGDRIVQALSRAAGPIVLILAYAALLARYSS